MTTLFDPIRLGDLALPNRIVMAPMTRNRAVGTIPGERHARYYAQRATAGLVITEATQICPRGQGYPDTPGIHDDAQVRGWQLVTDAVHRAGGIIALQLWHVGRISHSSFHGGLPVSASAVRPAGQSWTPSGSQPAASLPSSATPPTALNPSAPTCTASSSSSGAVTAKNSERARISLLPADRVQAVHDSDDRDREDGDHRGAQPDAHQHLNDLHDNVRHACPLPSPRTALCS